MEPRVNQAQLERGVGGADRLLQLADRNRTGGITGTVAVAFIASVLEDANAEVNSLIGLAVDVNDPAVQTAPLLVRYELAIAVYLAWMRGAGGLAVPQPVRDEYERVLGELGKIAERKKGLGLPVRAATSQQVQQVVKRDTEPYYSPRSPRKRFDGWS